MGANRAGMLAKLQDLNAPPVYLEREKRRQTCGWGMGPSAMPPLWHRRGKRKREALAEGQMDNEAAARELSHLDYRISRRPLILARRKDRKAYHIAKAREHRAARLAAETSV